MIQATSSFHELRGALAAARCRVLPCLAAVIFMGRLLATPGFALPADRDLPGLCETAAIIAAADTGIPATVLRAITLGETGRRSKGQFRPWPWTVNMEGEGKWFATEQEARAYVDQSIARGARSFDVGCFQINHRWHGQAFSSIEQMFDPLENARYAAKFLKRLHSETGDWSMAAGAYHSRTPEKAERYRKRFDQLRAEMMPIPPQSPEPARERTELAENTHPPRTNGFPLLRGETARGRLGSLVPAVIQTGVIRLVQIE